MAPILGYYVLGIPVILLMTFYYSYEVNGIWMGLNLGNIFIFTYFGIVLYKIDWNEAVVKAKERAEKEGGGMPGGPPMPAFALKMAKEL